MRRWIPAALTCTSSPAVVMSLSFVRQPTKVRCAAFIHRGLYRSLRGADAAISRLP